MGGVGAPGPLAATALLYASSWQAIGSLRLRAVEHSRSGRDPADPRLFVLSLPCCAYPPETITANQKKKCLSCGETCPAFRAQVTILPRPPPLTSSYRCVTPTAPAYTEQKQTKKRVGIAGMKAPARDGTEIFDAEGKAKIGKVRALPPPLLPAPCMHGQPSNAASHRVPSACVRNARSGSKQTCSEFD